MALTLIDAITKVRSLIDESSSVFWEDDEITRWLNEGQNDIARRSECLRDSSTVSVTAGTQEYSAPTDMVRITRVTYAPTGSNQIYPLTYRDMHSADAIWGTMQATTDGTPAIWTSWGFPPSLTITLFPTPTQDGNINVFYYRLPSTLAQDSDTIEVPGGWEDLVVEYAIMLALRKDGDPRWQEAFTAYTNHFNSLMEKVIRFTDQSGQIDDMHGAFAPTWLYEGMGDW